MSQHPKMYEAFKREYNIWAMMKQRCNNPKAANYINYGAAGIKVCPEFETFSEFLRILGPAPSIKHTLDRIDNTLGYTVQNCRWADVETQQNNRTNGVHFAYQGKMLSSPQLARIAGIPTARMEHRLKVLKMAVEDAMALPKQSWVQRPVRQRTLDGVLVQQFASLASAADYAMQQQWPRTTRRKDGVVQNSTPLDYDGYKKLLYAALKASRQAWGFLWEYVESPESSI